jgi:phage shock protein PspC (stress-responsive transcriptional regulator)
MAMIDELERLSALRDKGALTETEYDKAKALMLDPLVPTGSVRSVRSGSPVMRRALTDRWMGGVCGGIARLTQSETWIWRLLFTGGLAFGGITAVLYVLLWIFVPSEEVG